MYALSDKAGRIRRVTGAHIKVYRQPDTQHSFTQSASTESFEGTSIAAHVDSVPPTPSPLSSPRSLNPLENGTNKELPTVSDFFPEIQDRPASILGSTSSSSSSPNASAQLQSAPAPQLSIHGCSKIEKEHWHMLKMQNGGKNFTKGKKNPMFKKI